jgi:hypothetical protein
MPSHRRSPERACACPRLIGCRPGVWVLGSPTRPGAGVESGCWFSEGGPLGRGGSPRQGSAEPLFGRDRDVEVLRSFVDQSAVEGGAVLLSGDAGVGKTVLLDAAAAPVGGPRSPRWATAAFRCGTRSTLRSDCESVGAAAWGWRRPTKVERPAPVPDRTAHRHDRLPDHRGRPRRTWLR